MPNDHLTVTAQPPLLAPGPPLPRRRSPTSPSPRTSPGRPRCESGTIDLMVTRDPNAIRDLRRQRQLPAVVLNPDGRPGGHGLRHPQHRRRPHQRPHGAPGPGLRHRRRRAREAVRGRHRQAQPEPVPPGLPVPARRQRLPHLRPGQGQAARGPGRPQPRRRRSRSPWPPSPTPACSTRSRPSPACGARRASRPR